MCKLINQIENIQNVYTSLDNYIFVDKNDNFYFNGVKESSYKSIYFVLDEHILKQNTENKLFLYLNDTLIKELSHSYIFSTYTENGCFYYENLHYDPKDDKVKKDIYYHDFNNDSVRLFAKGFNENFQLVLGKHTITFQPRTTLKSLSLLTGEYEWEVDLRENLGQYDTISKIFGVVDEVLWLVSERGVLFGISSNNGKIVHHFNFDGYDTFQQYGTVQMQYFRSLFDEKSGFLIGFYEHRYWEINLKEANPSLNITGTKLLNAGYYQKEFASPEGMTFDDNYIYFRDNELATIGVLNRKTKLIDWQHKLYDSPAVISDIQVSTGKLYALDTTGTLHIFEKEAE